MLTEDRSISFWCRGFGAWLAFNWIGLRSAIFAVSRTRGGSCTNRSVTVHPPVVNRLHVRAEFSALIGPLSRASALEGFRRLMLCEATSEWNRMERQPLCVSHQMIVVCVCCRAARSKSCCRLGLKPTRPNPEQFTPHLFSFHLNFQRVSLIRAGFEMTFFLGCKLSIPEWAHSARVVY